MRKSGSTFRRGYVPRWSLRAMLGTFVVVSLLIGAWTRSARIQGTAVAWVHDHGGSVLYAYQFDQVTGEYLPEETQPHPAWLPFLQSHHLLDFRWPVTSVELEGQDIPSGSPLADLDDLELLSLSECKIENLRGLKFAHLRELDLSGCDIVDLQWLRDCQRLRKLSLYRVPLVDLAGIERCQELECLRLEETGVADLSLVRGLSSLTLLGLNETRISDVNPLRDLKKLEFLSVAGTDISDVRPLSGLRNLKFLQLDRTRVRRIQSITGLPLETLTLLEAPIEDIAEIKHMTTLKMVLISYEMAEADAATLRRCSPGVVIQVVPRATRSSAILDREGVPEDYSLER